MQNFTNFCADLHEIFYFHWFNLSFFVICFNLVELTLFWQNIKYLVYVNIFHEAKLQAFVKIKMTLNQTSTLQNRMMFRELNSVTLEEMPS